METRCQVPLNATSSFKDAAAQLEQLWRHGEPPDLRGFLAAAGDLSPGEVLAVLRVDQRCRWLRGERVAAETYLREWPAAAADDRALELICHEFRLQETLGEAPSLEAFVARFPQYAIRLRQQIELHRDLASPAAHVGGDSSSEESVSPTDSVAVATAHSSLPSIPGYDMLRVLGRGTMGTVYQARQTSLNRLVAVKMMLGGTYASPAALARFRLEAETLAQLQHPNIVQVYGLGQHEDHLFCAIEYVAGGDLARKLAGVPQPARQAAQLIRELALALDSVHRLGVVHRDLKPANVLLTGEGLPKISDFGLAKWLDLGTGQTRTGEIVGTPSYMAPEQADGRVDEVGPATDLYALGAILYEMLTGRPPFQARSWVDALHQIRSTPPIAPSRLQPSVPRDLETICLKCLEKEPRQRYPSAAALAHDIEAFLAGVPIEGRRIGRWRQAIRWLRLRPAVAVALGAGIAAAAGLLVGAWWFSPLAIGSLTVTSLLAGAWWYGARLRSAMRELGRQQVLAQRGVERVHLLLETTRSLMSAPDQDAMLRLLTEATSRLANAERATIFLIDHESGELWSKVALGEDVRIIRTPLGTGIAGTVALTGETISIADAYADARFNRAIDDQSGFRTRNLLALPMRSNDGRVLGVFEILNKRTGLFEAEEVGLLGALAASAAAALDNVRRYTGAPAGARETLAAKARSTDLT